MKIAISGASGFVGTHLTTFFSELGHQVIPLTRAHFGKEQSNRLIQLLGECQVVINLAGATINKRWSNAYLKEMYESRILVTRKIVSALHKVPHKPALFISVSAVGYYATMGLHDEYSGVKGAGILADLCQAWEEEANQTPKEMRLVIARLGVVLAPHGGALAKMRLPLIYFRLATLIAPGSQPFAWISLEDVGRAFDHIIHNSQLAGVVNLVAPNRVTQKSFVTEIGRHYKAIATLKLPIILFKLLYGKGASFLTTGQSVVPAKLCESGFNYVTPTLTSYCDYLTALEKRK